MAEATALQAPIDSLDPATGDVFARSEATPVAALREVMARAWDTQISWARIGLAELVQVKYIDVDRLSRSPKPGWFGYDAALNVSADCFVEFLFAPSWLGRRHSARGAARTVFRSHRV